jgi:hypothetical protein
MRHHTLLQVSLALLLVALATTWLLYESSAGPGGAPPPTPPLPICSPTPTPAQRPPGPVTIDHRESSEGARDAAAKASGDSPVATHCPTTVVVSAPGARPAGDRTLVHNRRRAVGMGRDGQDFGPGGHSDR